ncbi:MAG TPA: hypothetical protein QF517_05850 [Pseudomonadales bacterium]|nr:hypothetical protein [Pseudomonadales bacterium]MDP7316496.1 hypothetical protein [Pseudomonadales bacterium]HJL61462.1 hypothetical protein [Pseudomonadales bacterium]HJP50445.1 hypothetical protein [Pseudomonadales bacterium]
MRHATRLVMFFEACEMKRRDSATLPLTLKMIWRLNQGLGIPAESLVKPTDTDAA